MYFQQLHYGYTVVTCVTMTTSWQQINIITILPKMILPFTGDTVLSVLAKEYTATKSMYTSTGTYVDQFLNM